MSAASHLCEEGLLLLGMRKCLQEVQGHSRHSFFPFQMFSKMVIFCCIVESQRISSSERFIFITTLSEFVGFLVWESFELYFWRNHKQWQENANWTLIVMLDWPLSLTFALKKLSYSHIEWPTGGRRYNDSVWSLSDFSFAANLLSLEGYKLVVSGSDVWVDRTRKKKKKHFKCRGLLYFSTICSSSFTDN